MYQPSDRSLHSRFSHATQSRQDQGLMFGLSGSPMGPPSMHYLPQPVEIDLSYSRSSGPHSPWEPATYSTGPSQEPDLEFHGIGNQYKAMQVSYMELPRRNSPQSPLTSWYATNDGPYIPKGAIPDPGFYGHSPPRGHGTRFHARDLLRTGSHHQDAVSEYGTVACGIAPSDSGYETRRSFGTASMRSGDINRDFNLDARSVASHSQRERQYPDENLRGEPYLTDPFNASQLTPEGPRLICEECNAAVRTPSELKKHQLRHSKPYRCTHDGCKRTDGFSTSNDLDRHVRSKHPQPGTSKTWQCFVPMCKLKDKRWPRLDNFRSHLKRVHQFHGEKLDEYVLWVEEKQKSVSEVSGDGSLASSGPLYEMPLLAAEDDQFQDPFQQSAMQGWSSGSPMILDSPGSAAGNPTESQNEGTSPSASGNPVGEMEPLDPPSFSIGVPPAMDGEHRLHQEMKPGMVLGQEASMLSSDVYTYSPAFDPQINKRSVYDYAQKKTLDIDDSAREAIMVALTRSRLGFNNPNDQESFFSPKGATSNLTLKSGSFLGDHNSPGAASEISLSNSGESSLLNRDLSSILESLAEAGYSIKRDDMPKDSRPIKANKLGASSGKKTSNSKACPQPQCSFRGRECELRKHQKRHDRPYGCTHVGCNKTFGSKNDWKRHENSQHFRHELWQCLRTKDDGTACDKITYHPENFRNHLQRFHDIQNVSDTELQRQHVSNPFDPKFWCGFCAAEVDVDPRKEGLDAWTQRFNHIDDHFMGKANGKKLSILSWKHESGTTPQETPSAISEESSRGTDISLSESCSPDAVDCLIPRSVLGKRSRGDEEPKRPAKIQHEIIVCVS